VSRAVDARASVLAAAAATFDDGTFRNDLARRVAMPTESENPQRADTLRAYLSDEIAPSLAALGIASALYDNPVAGAPPLLIGDRIEDPALPTVLVYGHGDVVRGHEGRWRDGRDPWTLTAHGERWYGRGSADNKGQHSINVAALAALRSVRGGSLGFNVKWLVEMGEETGSAGLAEFCAAHRAQLAADVLIASDGPRLRADRPTVYLGTRGVANFDLTLALRQGGHHSGNWGGLLRNPGTVMASAIASIVDARGRILVDGLRPPPIPASVRRALADIEVGGDANDPAIDPEWGEPGLSPAERVFGWCSFEVLAYKTGNPETPVNAIPPRAWARCQLRFVVGIDEAQILPALRRHLDRQGFPMVTIAATREEMFHATRIDPEDPWVQWAMESLARTSGKKPALLPNLGGSLPNDIFTDVLGLRTVWVPHSYPGCSQHAPNGHLPPEVLREALSVMTGLFWDLGAGGTPKRS
jgi:acetylornithine deacetylase/succinyl-diaminopimelate desuccinylase-like protein